MYVQREDCELWLRNYPLDQSPHVFFVRIESFPSDYTQHIMRQAFEFVRRSNLFNFILRDFGKIITIICENLGVPRRERSFIYD